MWSFKMIEVDGRIKMKNWDDVEWVFKFIFLVKFDKTLFRWLNFTIKGICKTTEKNMFTEDIYTKNRTISLSD